MKLSKDTYEYLLNFADDKTVLSMLSVNKKFNDDEFFEKIMKKRYPTIIEYKKLDESWKDFYIEQIYWISKTREEFNFEPLPYILPKYIYRILFAASSVTTKHFLRNKNHLLFLSLIYSLKKKDILSAKKVLQRKDNPRRSLSLASRNFQINKKEFEMIDYLEILEIIKELKKHFK
jgi:hypothetical protein